MYGNYFGGSCRPKRGGDKPLLIGSENTRWPFCFNGLTGDTCNLCYVLGLTASVTLKGQSNPSVLLYSIRILRKKEALHFDSLHRESSASLRRVSPKTKSSYQYQRALVTNCRRDVWNMQVMLWNTKSILMDEFMGKPGSILVGSWVRKWMLWIPLIPMEQLYRSCSSPVTLNTQTAA